jgi:hypothetical protein
VPFILLAMDRLFEIYLMPNSELNLLKVGIYVALASMCYFPSIVLILWVIIVLPIAKKGSLRLQIIPLLGFLAVYFFYFVGIFLFSNLQTVWNGYGDYFRSFRLLVTGFNLKTIALLVMLIVPTIFLIFGSNNTNLEKTVAVRTKISMVTIMLFFALFLLFVGSNVLMNGLIFIVLSVLVAYAFSYISNTGWANLFLTLFMMLVFANQYYFKWL